LQARVSNQDLADALSRTAWDAARAEDASVIAPSPPVSALGLQRSTSTRGRDPLFLRRTIIPILLTGGLILAALGAYLRLWRRDDALADLLPSWAPIAFIGLAVLFLGVGILNVLWVRQALARYRAPR
jgi:hypothetical protein